AAMHAGTPRTLLIVIIVVAGLSSTLLVNDTVCLMMTPIVLAVVRELELPPLPYLLAVATASNIGGVMTLTGNPQNLVSATGGEPASRRQGAPRGAGRPRGLGDRGGGGGWAPRGRWRAGPGGKAPPSTPEGARRAPGPPRRPSIDGCSAR